jgi:hypothetical protein
MTDTVEGFRHFEISVSSARRSEIGEPNLKEMIWMREET